MAAQFFIAILVVFLQVALALEDRVTFPSSESPAAESAMSKKSQRDTEEGRFPLRTFVRKQSSSPTLSALETTNVRHRCKGGSTIKVDPRPVDYSTATLGFQGAQNKSAALLDTVGGQHQHANTNASANTINAWASVDTVNLDCWYSDQSAELTTMQEGIDALLFEDSSYLDHHKGVDVKNVLLGRGGPVEEPLIHSKIKIWPGPLNGESAEDAALMLETATEDFNAGLLKEPKTGQLVNYFQRTKPENRLKLFCGTYSFAKKHGNVANERHLWGHKCERHVLFTNPRVPKSGKPYDTKVLGAWVKPKNMEETDIIEMEFPGGEKYTNMWQKTRHAFQQMAARSWELIEPYDWFFFGGDDVFLYPENLHKMLQEPPLMELNQAGVPLFMGYRHKQNWTQSTFISGAAYVMNKAAVLLFAEGLMDSCMAQQHGHAEDVWLSECLHQVGVPSRDTRDHKGEDRFVVMTPGMMAEMTKSWEYTWWWREYRPRQYPRGLDIVSEYPIIFHFTSGHYFKHLAKRFYRLDPGGFPN